MFKPKVNSREVSALSERGKQLLKEAFDDIQTGKVKEVNNVEDLIRELKA